MNNDLYYAIRELKTFRDLAMTGNEKQVWFIERDWDGNDIYIVDSNNERLFSIKGGIHLATYMCMLHNNLLKLIKEVESHYDKSN